MLPFKAFKLIRKENLLDTVDVWILSAELGLIHSSEPISWYELKMNETRSTELINQELGNYGYAFSNVNPIPAAAQPE